MGFKRPLAPVCLFIAGVTMTVYFLSGLLALCVTLIVLHRKSQTFRFHTLYFCYNFSLMLIAVYATCVGLLHPWDVENFHRCAGHVYFLLVKLFSIRVRIEGLEIFDAIKENNFIIVANHQSSLDMLPILSATPRRTSFLAKKELLFIPPFGFAAWLFGVIFINRRHSKSARTVMEKTAEWIVQKKVRIKVWSYVVVNSVDRRSTGL